MKKTSFFGVCLIGLGVCFSGVTSAQPRLIARVAEVIVIGVVVSEASCAKQCYQKSGNGSRPICTKISPNNPKCDCSCRVIN